MSVLDKYRSVVVVNSEYAALQLSQDLQKRPRGEQFAAFAGVGKVGYFYLHANEALQPDTVLERVMSAHGDGITSLYRGHPIFETKADLLRARDELCNAIAQKIGLPVESIGIDDAARGRALGLDELATGQLIDLLAERLGHVQMATDTHAIDHNTAKAAPSGPEQIQVSLDDIDSGKVGMLRVGAGGQAEVA